ncbi:MULTISPECIES: T6SS immunity protein Tli3 family protein [Pseudescherichia]|uniref:T6SS immunity protein Tli3 family protein n=1 Tax=Pseudescherichia TaxID=2055880 RepID=UPI0021502FBC|nr:hypothetical protein [Pseudescherichia sp. L3]MCR4457173.1 hypothetical protein [Pseudescherichia sp. L3]
MIYKLTAFFVRISLLGGALLSLSGCVTEGAAFGLGAGSLHETVMTEKDKNAPPPVYGPPQIIYQIDDNRYFTLENYTRCEDGQTFYNNKKKEIHVKILDGSGYLFKGRLFWLSTRDDYLAFPATINTRHAACMGSDKGCMNAVLVTTDSGNILDGIAYGGYTQDPTGDTKDYDMIVTDNSFYLIYYRSLNRTYPVVDRWDFDKKSDVGFVRSDNEYELLRPGEDLPPYGFYKLDLSKLYPRSGDIKMRCDRKLEPVQPLRK